MKWEKFGQIVFLMLGISLMVVLNALAQGPPPDREKVREKIETMRTWKLIEYLDLSEKQSDEFLPVLKNLRKNESQLFEKRREILEKIKLLVDEEKPSPDKIKELLSRLEDNRKKLQQERELFLDKSKLILSIVQQGKLALFEERFEQRMKEIIDEVKERKKGREF
jgi:Spy/CpxP family protein refolding chaperone